MPAFTQTNSNEVQLLADLGARLRLARKRRGLSATEVAQRAGITRVTLGRLEVGEQAAVTLGTLTRVLGVLGMAGDVMLVARDDRVGRQMLDRQLVEKREIRLPALIALKDLPQLREVAAWHIRDPNAQLTHQEAFSLYERNWRHIEPAKITGKEAKILKALTQTVGKGAMLV